LQALIALGFILFLSQKNFLLLLLLGIQGFRNKTTTKIKEVVRWHRELEISLPENKNIL
jgi:hypothetical protein